MKLFSGMICQNRKRNKTKAAITADFHGRHRRKVKGEVILPKRKVTVTIIIMCQALL